MQHGEAATRGRWNAAPIAAPDHAGVSAAFDQHAQVLFAYCQSRLGEPAEAAGAVQDTFIVASARAARLSQPGRLRAWLFAVARNECHRRLGAGVRSAPLYEAAEAMDDTGTLSAITEQAELRALVRAALARLDPLDREISELSLRYGLLGADLGAVLGVPASQAPVLAARASSRFQQSLGVLRVGRSGRQYCSDLAAAIDGWRATPAVLHRWRVERHVERCAVCADLRRRGVNPAMLLSMLTVPALPSGLRERVLYLVADDAPDAAGYRADVIERAEPFDQDGFPVQLTTPSASRWLGTSVIAASVAVGALALLGGGMYYVDYTSTHSAARTQSAAIVTSARPSHSPSPSPSPSPSHSPSPSPTPPPVVAAQPAAPSPSPSPSHKPSPSKSPSPSPSKSASPSPSKSASPSPSLSPSPSASLSLSPSPSTIAITLTP